jgi:hypothetical protein
MTDTNGEREEEKEDKKLKEGRKEGRKEGIMTSLKKRETIKDQEIKSRYIQTQREVATKVEKETSERKTNE